MTTAGPLSVLSSTVKSDSGYQTPISIVPGDLAGGYVHRVPCACGGIFMSLKMIVRLVSYYLSIY